LREWKIGGMSEVVEVAAETLAKKIEFWVAMSTRITGDSDALLKTPKVATMLGVGQRRAS
jgi:hypothetical protein